MVETELIIQDALKELTADGRIGRYHYGTEGELTKLFSINQVKYPMVYLVMPLEGRNEYDIHKKELNTRIKLIICTSSKKEWFNDVRNQETYKKVLVPLYNDLLKTFNNYQYIDIQDRTVVNYKLHNYHKSSTTKEKRTVLDYWDVIVMEFDARVRENC